MSINWDTPISDLMHSDTTPPLGLIESDEELMHWKYIKKEKKNGKWVYYYDTEAADKELKSYSDQMSRARAESVNAYIALDDANKKYLDAKNSFKDGTSTKIIDTFNRTRETKKARYADYQQAEKNRIASVEKYENMKIKHIAHRTISRGIIAVANFLSGLFS